MLENPTNTINQLGQEMTGQFVLVPFHNKIGRPIEGVKDWFFETKNKRLFIKDLAAGITDENLKQLKGKTVKIRAQLQEGLWDTDDPNVQSRIGEYLVVFEIL